MTKSLELPLLLYIAYCINERVNNSTLSVSSPGPNGSYSPECNLDDVVFIVVGSFADDSLN